MNIDLRGFAAISQSKWFTAYASAPVKKHDKGGEGVLRGTAFSHHVVLCPLAELDHFREPRVSVKRSSRGDHVHRRRCRRVLAENSGGGGRGRRHNERGLTLDKPVANILVLRERPKTETVLGLVTE